MTSSLNTPELDEDEDFEYPDEISTTKRYAFGFAHGILVSYGYQLVSGYQCPDRVPDNSWMLSYNREQNSWVKVQPNAYFGCRPIRITLKEAYEDPQLHKAVERFVHINMEYFEALIGGSDGKTD